MPTAHFFLINIVQDKICFGNIKFAITMPEERNVLLNNLRIPKVQTLCLLILLVCMNSFVWEKSYGAAGSVHDGYNMEVDVSISERIATQCFGLIC